MSAAVLVGEPICEKPNSYQEPREMPIPNSHIVLRYSTHGYAFVKKGLNEIKPDVPETLSWISTSMALIQRSTRHSDRTSLNAPIAAKTSWSASET